MEDAAVSVLEPFNIPAVFPNSGAFRAITLNENTLAVLLSIMPVSLVNAAIAPRESSLTLSLVVLKFTAVLLAVFPA